MEPQTRSRLQDALRIRRRERCLRFDPHRLGVAHDDRDSHARSAYGQIGKLEDLACLLAELDLLVVLEAVELPVHAQLMVVGVLRPELGDGVGAGARHRLVGRDPHALEPCGVVQRCERHRQRNRAAVRVRDDSRVLERALAIHLGHDERDTRLEPESRRLVHAERTRSGREGNELATDLGADREEADVEVAGAQRRGRRLLDLEVTEPLRRRSAMTRTCGCWCIRDRPGTGA